jgi:serine/threonine protein kinase
LPNLIVERGREKGQTYELASGVTVVVGRDPTTAQIVIADTAASRRHFQLLNRNGKWFVADLGSKNFTFVNEEKLEREVELTTGDRVQVGETVFTFNDDQKADDKAAGLSGKEIGGYKILERIGRGGMGTVFKAKQISLNRLVALKFLSPKLSKDPSFVEKFFAEARAAAQLNHPNVVQVFDVGTLSGVHFFSMEFMEGGCVQDLLSAREDSRLPWQDALPLVVDSVRGLVFAEKRGIIHRDIKPDNLMLTSEQKVKIGDLGLATSVEAEKEKGIFGTPHFIAPEQAQGREVTHAADLYALGGTFYRMVCGKTPFSGSTVKEILRAQINDPHVPVVQVVPDFPPELSSIIDRLMAKKVEDRYQSATKLLEDLEAFQLAHQIEMAGGVKSRKPFLIAVGILLVALAGVIAYIALKEPPPPEIRETTVRGGTVVVEKDRSPEELQQIADTNAKSAFYELKSKEASIVPIARERAKEWTTLSKEYDQVAEQHAGSPTWAKQASDRASEIRITLEQLETTYRTVIQAAEQWWKKASDEIKAHLGLQRWGDAARAAQAVLDGEDLKKHREHLPKDAEAWLRKVADEAYAEAMAENARLLAEAEGLMKNEFLAEGLKRVEEWEKKVRDQGLTEPRWVQLADSVKDWREARTTANTQRLADTLTADKNVFVDAWRKVRHLPADASDNGGTLWSYRFADAARELRGLCEGRVKTWLYRDRVELTAQRLEEAQVAWDGFIRAVAEKRLWGKDEPIPGADKSAKVTIDPDKPATSAEFFAIVSVSAGAGGSGSRKAAYPWDEYAPSDLYHIYLQPKLDRIPPELTLGLARAFALLAEPEATVELLERSKDTVEAKAWVMAEHRALAEWDVLRRAATSPMEIRRACTNWLKSHYRTEAFVLLCGESVEETPHLFPEEDLDRYVETFGARPPK